MLKGIIIEKFGSIQLSKELIKALKEEGYENPTSIQKKAIPVLLNKKDLIAAAKSGTGKTAAFLLPMLEQLKQEIDYNKKEFQEFLLLYQQES